MSSGEAVHLPADFDVTAYQGAEALGGQQVAFSAVVGQGKPVVLNFWAGLCPPCRAEMPDIQAVHESLGDQALIFGLDIGPFVGLGSRDDGRALLQELGVTYPTGTTFDAKVVSSYQVTGMPTTVFLKPDGQVHKKWTGLLIEQKLAELTEDLIRASRS